MGNQPVTCALPEDAAGRVLREMAGPGRIAITDRFWFELLKVRLPGVEQAGYFEAHYREPWVLDGLVRSAYFLQLVATNEHSGNFRTFLRFWARLLHYYRTSPRDAKPCGAASILSLSLLCRCLLKQFAETFTAPELIFQLEQAPYEPAAEAEKPVLDGSFLLSYCGRRFGIQLPTMADGANSSGSTAGAQHVGPSCTSSPLACLEPLCVAFPEDAQLLRDAARCALRATAEGETFPAVDVAERVAETGVQELVACPCGVPRARGSVLRSVFREVCDFLVSSSFGAMSGASPSLLADSDGPDGGEWHPAPRNLSTAPHTILLQSVLLEIILLLGAVVAPRYAPVAAPPRDAAVLPRRSRADFCAPFLFLARERRKRPISTTVATAGSDTRAPSKAWAGGKEEGAALQEAPSLAVPQPPAPGEAPMLPFLSALLQVLGEEEDESSTGAGTVLSLGSGISDGFVGPQTGDSGGTGEEATSNNAQHMDQLQRGPAETGCDGDHGERRALRAEALLATLLNFVWLEPHASSLPRPPKEVLRLLTGVALPVGNAPPPPLPVDAENDVMPAAADERAAARAAAGAASNLSTRAILALLLLLFHEPHAHSGVAAAFAALHDPLLDVSGKRALHTAAAAPLNFTQLLKAVLRRIQEGVYPLLLYCLVQRSAGFRRYCLCRVDADEVLVPILEVLHGLPSALDGSALTVAPASTVALLLTLLTLTGDRGFCEGASRTRLRDAGPVLGGKRLLREVSVSSLLIEVLLRLAHWNFATCRDAFFNSAIAGIFSNLAVHGVEHLHWHCSSRLLDMTQLLARNALKASGHPMQRERSSEEGRRDSMVRELLAACAQLLSGCLRVPLAARNCALAYALQRAYPPQLHELEKDPEFGPAFRHVYAVVAWFQGQCPPDDNGGDYNTQFSLLEAAASRLPGAVDALSTSRVGGSAYSESPSAPTYFMPVIWRAAAKLLPDHVCWSRPQAGGGGARGGSRSGA